MAVRNEKFRMLQAQTAAREYLVLLGVPRHKIPKNFAGGELYDPDSPEERAIAEGQHRAEHHPWSVSARHDPNKRFKRTKKEMEQLRQFTEWQKAQRTATK